MSHAVGMDKAISSQTAITAFETLAADLTGLGVTVGRMFGATSLMLGGKAVGCLHGDGVAFKLGRDSVAHATALGFPDATLFDPSGMGRPFKDWVVVPLACAERWADLGEAAIEAAR